MALSYTLIVYTARPKLANYVDPARLSFDLR